MKFFALSLLALAVTGCAVGPDYRAPQPEPARIAHAEDSDYDRSRFESAWWHQFEDPTLDALVVQALTENRELRIAYSRLRAARAIRRSRALPIAGQPDRRAGRRLRATARRPAARAHRP